MATFTIDLLTGKVFLFSGNFSGSGSTPTSGSTYPAVSNYADLPAPASSYGGQIYLVRNGSGAYVLNRRDAGFYYSDGVAWNNVPNVPPYFSSANFQVYDNIVSTKGLSFVTSGITSGFKKLTIQNGDGTIAYLTDLNTKLNTSIFTTYTGTTAPNQFASKTTAVTGATNLGSGAGIYTSVAANKLQLKGFKGLGNVSISTDSTSITISGSTATWNTLSGRPPWLTGTTLQNFQTGHTHSYNNLTDKLTAGSGISLAGNVISVTGSTPSTTYNTLQLLDTSGGTDVNTISITPITWIQQVFSGTSLNFTGGSRIYIRATGVYDTSYVLNIVNNTNSAKNIGSVLRKNGNTDMTPMSSTSFSQDLTNELGTNAMPQYMISLSNGDYVELVAFRIGYDGIVNTKAHGSWIKIKRIS